MSRNFEEIKIGKLSISIAEPSEIGHGGKTMVQSQRSPTSQLSQNYLSSRNSSTTSVSSSTQPQIQQAVPQAQPTTTTPSTTPIATTSLKKTWKKTAEFISSTDSDWFGPEDTQSQLQQQSIQTSMTTSTNPSKESSSVSLNTDKDPTKIEGRLLPSPPKESLPKIIPSKPIIHQQKESSSLSSSPKKDDDWQLISRSDISSDTTAAEVLELNSKIARIEKLQAIVCQENVDMDKLKKFSWNGIPDELRPFTWKLLLGYMPSNKERQIHSLQKKRAEYKDYLKQTIGRGQSSLNQVIWHQIHIDIPRTNPSIKLYQSKQVQESLERILYCWAIRHPASGYVQGINDLATPFYQVFLSEYTHKENVETFDVERLTQEELDLVEADTFWCLSKLLDGIQDNYTHGQPGILRQIQRMKELIGRIDAQLLSHMQSENVDFIQFAFRWMNCLLMREMPMSLVIRMWDTYLVCILPRSEGPDGFRDFHVYVCGAFLVKWSNYLKKLEFQDMIMFLQALPTKLWGDKEIELLLSEAYMWKSLFHNSPSHLSGSAKSNQNGWSI